MRYSQQMFQDLLGKTATAQVKSALHHSLPPFTRWYRGTVINGMTENFKWVGLSRYDQRVIRTFADLYLYAYDGCDQVRDPLVLDEMVEQVLQDMVNHGEVRAAAAGLPGPSQAHLFLDEIATMGNYE
jgi:hypothetical protein